MEMGTAGVGRAETGRAETGGARDIDGAGELGELEVRVLDFERAWASRVGAKDAAIRAEFSIPAARYYQMLYALIDSPVALRSDPLLVRRLQRLREVRARARAARTFRTETTIDQDPTE